MSNTEEARGGALRRALTGALRGDPRAVVGVVVAAVLVAVAVLGVAGRPTMGAFTAEVENTENSAGYPDLQSCLEHFTNIGLKGGGAYYIAATKRGNGDNWIDDLSYPQGIDQFREDNPYLPAGTVLRPRTAGIYNHLNKVRTAPPGDEPCPADMDYPGSQWDHEGAILNKEFHSMDNFKGIGSYSGVMWIKPNRAPAALFTVPGAGAVNWDGWPTSRIYASAHIFPDGTLAFRASASRTGDNHNTPVHPLRAVVQGKTSIVDGRWHQVAFVLDRNPVDELGNKIAGSQLRIYVDGRLDGETTVSYTFPQRTANFRFGCDAALWGGIGGNNGAQCFTGRMGLVAAYPFAVTEEDLKGAFRRDIKPQESGTAEGPDISEGLNAIEGLAELNLPEGRNESEEQENPESLEGPDPEESVDPAETPGQPGTPDVPEEPAGANVTEQPA